MITDSQHTFSDAQALTGTGAASTNVIDLGVDNNIGIGEPMAAVITCDAALAGTSPTLAVALQTDSAVGFGTVSTLSTTGTYAALAVGDKIVIPVPPGLDPKRYLRLNYTLGGTTPSVTLTAQLQPMSMIQNDVVYPKGYTIQ